jgi:hypothetical protein
MNLIGCGIQLEVALDLYHLLRTLNIKTVVETGIDYGISSAVFLHGGCELYSIEPKLKKDIKDTVNKLWLPRWRIIEGRSQDKLPELLQRLGRIDLFWHDSEHTYEAQMFEYETALPHAKFIGSHDIRHKSCIKDGNYAWDDFLERYNWQLIFQNKWFGVAYENN